MLICIARLSLVSFSQTPGHSPTKLTRFGGGSSHGGYIAVWQLLLKSGWMITSWTLQGARGVLSVFSRGCSPVCSEQSWRSGAVHPQLVVHSYDHHRNLLLSNLEYLAVKCRPFKTVRKFYSILIVATYISPWANAKLALKELYYMADECKVRGIVQPPRTQSSVSQIHYLFIIALIA